RTDGLGGEYHVVTGASLVGDGEACTGAAQLGAFRQAGEGAADRRGAGVLDDRESLATGRHKRAHRSDIQRGAGKVDGAARADLIRAGRRGQVDIEARPGSEREAGGGVERAHGAGATGIDGESAGDGAEIDVSTDA